LWNLFVRSSKQKKQASEPIGSDACFRCDNRDRIQSGIELRSRLATFSTTIATAISAAASRFRHGRTGDHITSRVSVADIHRVDETRSGRLGGTPATRARTAQEYGETITLIETADRLADVIEFLIHSQSDVAQTNGASAHFG
jgi:hypothetical protein